MKHPLADCENCPLRYEGKYVPPDMNRHSPDNPAKYVFVGEAPGQKEAKTGKPFQGISGKLLDALLEGHGIDRKDAALTNAVLCRPPGNATPTAPAVHACAPALQDVIAKASPEYVVAMGNTAASAVLGRKVKITKERVGPPQVVDGKPYKVVPTIHPAATLRNTNQFPLLESDIAKLKTRVVSKWQPPNWKAFEVPGQAIAALKQITALKPEYIVLDLEVGEDKDVEFGHPDRILCTGISYAPGKAVVIGFDAMQDKRVKDALIEFLHSNRVVCQNGKYDLQVLFTMGYGNFKLYKDTMLQSYCLNELKGVHGLEYKGQEVLGVPNWKQEFHDICGNWAQIAEQTIAGNETVRHELYKYNAYDCDVTRSLVPIHEDEMDEDDKRLHEYLCNVSDRLKLVEARGVRLDRPLLQLLDRQLREEVRDLKADLVTMAQERMSSVTDEDTIRLIKKNGKFNPNSHVQVKGVLGGMLGTTVVTSEAAFLEQLVTYPDEGVNAFATKMLAYRSVAKMHGTYVLGWMKLMDDNDRVRTTLKIIGTETGRLSSAQPNVQNPPRGDFRRVIIPEEGKVFVYADYGNIEGRIVSVESDCQPMQDIFRDGKRDIHSEVTAMFYGENFTKEQRVLGKTVVHGANYARGAEGIAEGLGVPLRDARKVYNAYHSMFPEVKEWQADIKRRVITEGETLVSPWGRKRRFGLITRENIEDVYKEALAFLPQSIGSDICLSAALDLVDLGFDVQILIHDGILIQCDPATLDKDTKVIREVMEASGKRYTDLVPFPVDIEVGPTWADVKSEDEVQV